MGIRKCGYYAGKEWVVIVKHPEGTESALKSEGELPTRGMFEDHLMWIHKKNKLPYAMIFS